MKSSKILIFISLAFFFTSCKKSDSKVEPEKDEFSFTYNGQNYNYSITGNTANAGVGKGMDGTPNLLIDMVNLFGGRVYFEKTGCAYLEPQSSTVMLNSGCMLSERNSSGTAVPIDSSKVFIYESGSLNVPFSNCISKSGTDIITGLPYQYNDCAAIGTFDLTLKNNSNSTIKITNGIVKLHHVIVR